MMPSYLGVNLAGAATGPFPADALWDELSRQIASSPARRSSRGSNNYRTGTSMRIVKPRSANNSPRSLFQSRRRTIIADSFSAPRNQLVELSYLSTPAAEIPVDVSIEHSRRTTRPVSWHPSSHLAHQVQQPQPMTQYPFPQFTEGEAFPTFNPFPPTPAAYSGYTSPSSTFSPLSLPYSGIEAPQYWPGEIRADESTPFFVEKLCEPQNPVQALPADARLAMPNTTSDWNPMVGPNFSRCASPPTPENYPPARLPETKLSPEESIPYEPLEDDESEGEILYGMGLYDAPEKPEMDSVAMSHLFTGAGSYPESTGKGLKLEDAWEPPSPEDGDEEEDDDSDEKDGDDDAQGEDVDD